MKETNIARIITKVELGEDLTKAKNAIASHAETLQNQANDETQPLSHADYLSELGELRTKAANLNKSVYDLAVAEARKADNTFLELAKVGGIELTTVSDQLNEDQGFIINVTEKPTLIDYRPILAEAKKANASFTTAITKALRALHRDVVAASLQDIYLSISDESAKNADEKKAIVKKAVKTLGVKEWDAMKELNTLHSKKVSKSLLQALVDTLMGKDTVAMTKKHVAWLENIVVSKGKDVFSLQICKEETLLSLVWEAIVAAVNNLDLEVLG